MIEIIGSNGDEKQKQMDGERQREKERERERHRERERVRERQREKDIGRIISAYGKDKEIERSDSRTNMPRA